MLLLVDDNSKVNILILLYIPALSDNYMFLLVDDNSKVNILILLYIPALSDNYLHVPPGGWHDNSKVNILIFSYPSSIIGSSWWMTTSKWISLFSFKDFAFCNPVFFQNFSPHGIVTCQSWVIYHFLSYFFLTFKKHSSIWKKRKLVLSMELKRINFCISELTRHHIIWRQIYKWISVLFSSVA